MFFFYGLLQLLWLFQLSFQHACVMELNWATLQRREEIGMGVVVVSTLSNTVRQSSPPPPPRPGSPLISARSTPSYSNLFALEWAGADHIFPHSVGVWSTPNSHFLSHSVQIQMCIPAHNILFCHTVFHSFLRWVLFIRHLLLPQCLLHATTDAINGILTVSLSFL